MAEVVITYETLYELLRREKSRPEIQKISESFVQEVCEYIGEKKNFLEEKKNGSTLFESEVKRIENEVVGINRILKELYDRRELKIINLAVSKAITDTEPNLGNLLPEEERLYDSLCKELVSFREKILGSMLKGDLNSKPKAIKSENLDSNIEQPESKVEVSDSRVNVRFLTAVPEFCDGDGHVYGPFEKDDLAYLSKKEAELLLKSERVEKL